MSTVCLMGFETLVPKFNDLCSKLQSLNFDRCDYAAFKVLTLFEDQGLLEQKKFDVFNHYSKNERKLFMIILLLYANFTKKCYEELVARTELHHRTLCLKLVSTTAYARSTGPQCLTVDIIYLTPAISGHSKCLQPSFGKLNDRLCAPR